MKIYDANHVRNIALVGHQGSGKTMLAEAMLFTGKAINRIGTIEEGSTVSDYHTAEKDRQMSIFSSLLHVEWEGHKINILDTPGYPDFAGEVISALKVADVAVFVINANEGVQVGTELAWAYAEANKKPCMFVVNKLDNSDKTFDELIAPIQDRYGRGATVVQLPGGRGTRSIIDVLLMQQLTFPGDGRTMETAPISETFAERADELHNELVENIAENDEELMELYFEAGSLTEAQMRDGLRTAMIERQLFPIFITSATQNVGVGRLLGFVNNVFPSPAEMPKPSDVEGDVSSDPEAAPAAFVFSTMSEQHVGDYSFMKVYSGVIDQGLDLENAQTGDTERLGTLFSLNGNKREPVQKLHTGDLGTVVKLKNTHTNNTLRKKGSGILIEPIVFPEPRYTVAVRATTSGEEDKMAQGMHQLTEEDPSLNVIHDTHLNQLLLAGQGEMHLLIARSRLKRRFGVEVEFSSPRISYREAVKQRGDASYRHKKQTGGAGQFADITLYVEPLDGPFEPPSNISVRNTVETDTAWGSKIEFIDAIVGGVIDMRRFFGAIQKGIAEILQEGPLAGYPVGDVRIVIYDGGMHAVDSNENAFKTAARMCFRDAFKNAKPVLLEPIQEVEITIPEEYMGDVLGDLNTRRARILGMEAEGVFQKVQAQVPEAELYRYSTALRSMTQGRGVHSARFHQYESVPRHVQEKIIEQAAALEEA